MRVVVPLSVLGTLVFAACGSDASRAAPATDAVAETANAVLAATRAKDSEKLCQLFPPSLVEYSGGFDACVDVQNDNFDTPIGVVNGRRSPESRVRSAPGTVVRVVDVSTFPRYHEPPVSYRRTWSVHVRGGRTPRPDSSSLYLPRPSELREARRLASQGIQCVTIYRTPVGLRGNIDGFCGAYAGRRRSMFDD